MERMHRHALLHLALAATLLLRGLIAPGYMPDGDGSLGLRLCPAGLGEPLAGALFGDDLGHSHHDHHGDELTSDELCPLGDGLGSASLTTVTQPGVVVPRPTRPLEPAPARRASANPAFFSARAPPVVGA